MPSHFLLSAAARTLSLRAIYAAGEAAAYDTFRRLRWQDTDGAPVCPRCGALDAYDIPTRRKWKCRACGHQFSVTSGTIFASRKMGFVDLLAAVCIVVNAAKGVSALQLSRDLDCQYRTAFVLSHKLREAMQAEGVMEKLTGEVEVDGMYVGGTIRPANMKEDRVDRRLAEHQTGKRRVVVAFRQRKGRTLPFVARSEAEGVKLAGLVLAKGSKVYADEASHWDALEFSFPAGRINHARAYSEDGNNTNLVESYFSRLRRMIDGQHHHVSARYLSAYANHAAWLEDHRRRDNGRNADALVWCAMASPVSRQWKGYWQRRAA